MKITGAIFDMDGTLLDSMDYWAIVAGEYLKSKGVTPFDDDNRYFLEDGLTAWYKRAIQAHGINASIEEVTAVIYEFNHIENKKRMANPSAYSQSYSERVEKAGILTSLPFAGGEADTLPSLLPAYVTTSITVCQALF